MAKILPGNILIGVSGRIGNLVTYNLNGTQVIRTLPETFKKRKSSSLQKQHLISFKIQHAMAKSVKKTIIDRIWSHLSFQGGMNPYNQFIKRNRAAYGGTDNIVFPELMVISDGNLLPAAGFTVHREGEILTFSWDSNQTGKLASPADKLNIVILAYRCSLNMMAVEACRSDGTISFALPDKIIGDVEGYVFWSSQNEENFSPSMFWVCR